jgi:hypothetical protein
LFTFLIKIVRKLFNILAIRGPTMLASTSNVAQIIELSYEFDVLALRGLWARPGQSKDRGQVLWDTLSITTKVQGVARQKYIPWDFGANKKQ